MISYTKFIPTQSQESSEATEPGKLTVKLRSQILAIQKYTCRGYDIKHAFLFRDIILRFLTFNVSTAVSLTHDNFFSVSVSSDIFLALYVKSHSARDEINTPTY
jgi:hypothetical protein